MKRVLMVVLIGLAALGAVYAGTRPEDMTREEKNKMLVNVAIGAFNDGDWELMAKLYSPKYVQHGPASAEPITWPELDLICRVARQTFPTLSIEIVDIIAEGDKVAVRSKKVLTFKESHSKYVRGPGKVELPEIDIFRIEAGRIVEEWCGYDSANVSAKMRTLRNVKTWQ